MPSTPIENIASGFSGRRDPLSHDHLEPVISINKLTGKAGGWYERIRYLLDYREERFIRRSAIERILKRKLLWNEGEKIGLTLLRELIHGGYLPNNEVPERLAEKVDTIILKFTKLYALAESYAGRLSKSSPIAGGKLLFRRRTFMLAASEIHQLLFPAPAAELSVEAFCLYVKPYISYTPPLDGREADIQTYLGCRRSLLKETDEDLMYALWVRLMPEWSALNPSDENAFKAAAARAPALCEKIVAAIRRPAGWKIVGKLRNHGIYFSIIREIFDKYGTDARSVFEDARHLEEYIRFSLDRKYEEEHKQTLKSGIRAVFYIFCTKMLVALALELPYDVWVIHSINFLALSINVAFHPLLLFLMITTVPKLKEDNTRRILEGVNRIAAGAKPAAFRITLKESSPVFGAVLTVLYGLLFVLSFGAVVVVLRLAEFNIASIALFLFFLTLVSYFGLRIRHNAKEWKVSADDESTLGLIWNLVTLPIVRAGRWLSKKFSSINVFLLIMDFLIEAPFKLILQVMDAFISFLKEKKEEIH